MNKDELIKIIKQAKNNGLKELNLSYKQIDEIPSEIGLLTELEELNLSRNQLKQLPSEIGNLTKLKTLLLSNNELNTLPESIGNLTALESLNLNGTNLKTLPHGIKNLKKLKSLKLLSTYIQWPAQYLTQEQINIKDFSFNWKELTNKSIVFDFKPNSYLEENFLANLITPFEKEVVFKWQKGFIIQTDEHETAITLKYKDYVNPIEIYIIPKTDDFSTIRQYLINTVQSINRIIDKTISVQDKPFINYSHGLLRRMPILKSIQIQNFKQFKHIKLQFTPNINLIVGGNGFGKTSLLQAITLALLPQQVLIPLPDDGDTSHLFQDYIQLGKAEAQLTVLWLGSSHTKKIHIREFQKTIQNSSYNLVPIILAYGTNLLSRRLLKHDDMVQHLIQGTGKMYNHRSLFKEVDTQFFNPLEILNKLEDAARFEEDNENQTYIENVQNLLLQKLNHFLQLNKAYQNLSIQSTKRGHLFFGFEQDGLQLRHLSEGYRSHILLITDILVRIIAARKGLEESLGIQIKDISKILNYSTGVIIIDEFDRHLHPLWQKDLLNNFQKVFPLMQFIVTTHNPVAVLDREREEIQVLEKEDDVIKILQHIGGTKDLDVEYTLMTYFGLDSILSTSLQKAVDDYYYLKIKNNTNTKEFKALEQRIDKSMLGIPIHDERYLTFLKFLAQPNIRTKKEFEEYEMTPKELAALKNALNIH